MGEHTDTTGGWCLPFAGDRFCAVAGSWGEEPAAELSSTKEPTVSFPLPPSQERLGHWGDYLRGLLLALPFSIPRGVRLAVVSEIPSGAGLSSSAALLVAFLKVLLALTQRELSSKESALFCQKAEFLGKGVSCGVMDMLAILEGKVGHALLLNTGKVEYSLVPLPLPQELTFCILESGIQRSLAHSAYNERQREAEQALEIVRKHFPNYTFKKGRKAVADCQKALGPLFRRAWHIATENERVLEMAEALALPNFSHRVGELLFASHESLQKNFEVSLPALDALVSWLKKQEGVLGARLMGAGFGGSLLALAKSSALPFLQKSILHPARDYPELSPSIYPIASSDGLSLECVEEL